jgi:hypothetical protein
MSLSIILKFYLIIAWTIQLLPVWNDLSFRKASFSPPSHNSHLLEILSLKSYSFGALTLSSNSHAGFHGRISVMKMKGSLWVLVLGGEAVGGEVWVCVCWGGGGGSRAEL